MKLYKVLAEGGLVHHGGKGRWPLPKDKLPGSWLHVDGEITACHNGLHLCRRNDLILWLGPTIYLAESKGEIITDTNKVVVANARLLSRLDTWNDRTARMFAADCATYAIRQCEKNGTNIDQRVKDSIETIYRYAKGEATAVELSTARSAAGSAVESMEWSAARSAAQSAESAAESAAWSAARSALWAERAAAESAESAAWSAARGAAWSERAAAWSAAESAARWAAQSAESAAWSERSAARSAARQWQTRRLFEYLDGTSKL